MRIGIMLRSLDEKGGIGVYTANIVRELLDLNSGDEFVLFYRNGSNLGRFSVYANVTEVIVSAGNKAIWDQIKIPVAAKKHKIDVLFHPKFTVPLFGKFKKVMVLHGADWFIPEHAKYYKKTDVRYIKIFMPWYIRKADAVLSVSELTTLNFNRKLKVKTGKIQTVYFAPGRQFRKVEDPYTLNKIRAKYQLPKKFIFSLSKYGVGGGNRKNIDQVFAAYQKYFENSSQKIPLVIGGKDCEKYRSDFNIPEHGYGASIRFPGWLDQHDLPAIYSMAEFFLYPSNVEAFPIPITEAMACGTPIITSDANGLCELAGDSAVYVDPGSSDSIKNAILKLEQDQGIKKELSNKSLQRSKIFDWTKCAQRTLEILKSC